MLRQVILLHSLLEIVVGCQDAQLLRATDATAKREDTTLLGVPVRRWMRNTERTIYTVTIFQWDLGHVWVDARCHIMARVTEVVRSKAGIERC